MVPPSLEALSGRLAGRATETAERRSSVARTTRRTSWPDRTSTTTWWSTRPARSTARPTRSTRSSPRSTRDHRTCGSGSDRRAGAGARRHADAADPAGRRFVEVAVDAAGVPGGRTYTYHVPPDARRRSSRARWCWWSTADRGRSASCWAEAADPGRDTKPVLETSRGERPVADPARRRLAQHVATHYLAPPGMVIRAMLPPGALERVELVAVAVEAAGGRDRSARGRTTRCAGPSGRAAGPGARGGAGRRGRGSGLACRRARDDVAARCGRSSRPGWCRSPGGSDSPRPRCASSGRSG